MRYNEQVFIDLVAQGFFSVDQNGAIWRHKLYRPRKGHPPELVCITPRRAETPTRKGYLAVQQTLNAQRYQVLAHRLVWLVLFGDIPEDLEVNHENGDKKDNHPRNLELMTGVENMQHAARTGLLQFPPPPIGERNHFAKLTEDIVRSILIDFQTGQYSQKDLATKYEQSTGQIHLIVRRKSWAHVQI